MSRPTPRILTSLSLACAVILSTGCEKRVDPETGSETLAFTGQPNPANRWVSPDDITDFNKLYTKYCLACHSIDNKTVSPVVGMGNGTYLSILPEDVLRKAITSGVPHSLMPGFAKSAGGEMTEGPARMIDGKMHKSQVEILVEGILAKKPAPDPTKPPIPAYSAPLGNPEAGKALYEQSVYAKAKDVEHSLLDPAFLGTVTDQYLRTLLIAGLPELTPSESTQGEEKLPASVEREVPTYPGYADTIPGRPLSTQDVSDLVAWIASHRENEYGERINVPGAAAPALPTEPPVTNPAAAQ